MKKQTVTLFLIIVSQFMCTSLWFAGNAVMPDLILNLGLQDRDLGHLTSSVQFGFITGTLFFAFFTIADRFNPSAVFFVSAVLGALFNVMAVIEGVGFLSLLILRFSTGFFLAGIYPVGMKIASDYYEKGLGRALSFLVGALVLGTALPHLISDFTESFSWESVMYATSGLALLGGLLIYLFVKPGPFRRAGQKQKFGAIFKVFKNGNFRSASFGYFGHMWELYAFWAFVPLMLSYYSKEQSFSFNIPLLCNFCFSKLRYLLFAIPIDVFNSSFCFCWISDFLGLGCHCRFTVIFNPCSSSCPARVERNFLNNCQLHWIFNNYYQHSIAQWFIGNFHFPIPFFITSSRTCFWGLFFDTSRKVNESPPFHFKNFRFNFITTSHPEADFHGGFRGTLED
jgi:MFS family permease